MQSTARRGGGQGLEHPGQLLLAPAEPPGSPSPSPRLPLRAGRRRGAAAWKAVGKSNRPPYLPPAPLHATLPNQPLFSVSPARPSALCSDPETPRGAPAQMERKEGSEARARKEPPRLPAIAQTPRSGASDMPRDQGSNRPGSLK